MHNVSFKLNMELIKDIQSLNPQNYTVREEVNLNKAKSIDYLINELLTKKYSIKDIINEDSIELNNNQGYIELSFKYENKKYNVFAEHINKKITRIEIFNF